MELVADPLPEEITSSAIRNGASPLNFFRLLAWTPKVGDRLSRAGGALLTSKRTDERERELLILRTAWHTACEYEFRQHAHLSRDRDLLSEAEIAAVQSDIGGHDWTDREAVVLTIVDELMDQASLRTETWDRAVAVLDHGQLVELITLAGIYRTVATLMNVADVPLDDFVPDAIRSLPFHTGTLT